MKTYWQSMNERERWMLGLGVMICAVYLIYLLIFSPIATAVHKKTDQVLEKRDTLAWMQGVKPQITHNKKAQSLTSSELLTNFADQLTNSSIDSFPHQLQQTGEGDIQLSFDKVPFNSLIQWLWDMNERYAIKVKQFSADKTEVSGVVKVMVVIGV